MTRLPTGGLLTIERPLLENSRNATPPPAAALPAPRGRRSSLEAAWEAGAQLNELQYQLQIACLTAALRPDPSDLASWDQLRLTVADLVRDLDAQDRLRAAVDRYRVDFAGAFKCEWFADELYSQNREIERRLPEDERGPAALIEEACEWLATISVDRPMAELRAAMESVMNVRQRHVLRLAGLVDHAVHPVPAYRQLTLELASDRRLGAPLSWDDRVTSSQPPQVPSYLPIARRAFRVPPIDDAWRLEVEQRWEHAGLSASHLPWRPDGESRFDRTADSLVQAVAQAFHTAVSHVMVETQTHNISEHDRLEGQSNRALAPSDDIQPRTGADQVLESPEGDSSNAAETGWSEPGRFDLRFHEASRQVQRGTVDPVPIASLQHWKLLSEFARHDRRISISELQNRWHDLGGSRSEPGRSTIYSVISRLREILNPLQLRLENRSRDGWKLVDAVTSAPPADDSQSA